MTVGILHTVKTPDGELHLREQSGDLFAGFEGVPPDALINAACGWRDENRPECELWIQLLPIKH